ncbi:LbetaH domain-containing protein [Paracoccus jeotgali]|uniref:Acetyltransferase n=1 Tax=Paracoccus jeotgali TaxID=2065379 RepID=A0A2K9MHH9_9RHOB|nr:acetyltransferase [Paracoccus jeotgali]AUM75097.1 acetyltransferase [Paracoccus jeotgali]
MKSTSEFTDFVVFGARGTSLMLMRGMVDAWPDTRLRALIDDIENGFVHPSLQIPVISMDRRAQEFPDLPVLVTAANTKLREAVFRRLEAEGATLATGIARGQRHVDPGVIYGPGCQCAPFTRIGPDVTIGTGAQVLATLVAHDVELGDFSNLGVNSSVLGHVKIGRHVNVAPHAVIANGTRTRPLVIGDGAVVGVGAVVTRSVAPGVRVSGNPAMPMPKWRKLWRILHD